MRHPILDDKSHPLWHAKPRMTPKEAAGYHASAMKKHLELFPDIRYLFCEHGCYVGANGCLKDLFCRFCKEEMSDPEADS